MKHRAALGKRLSVTTWAVAVFAAATAAVAGLNLIPSDGHHTGTNVVTVDAGAGAAGLPPTPDQTTMPSPFDLTTPSSLAPTTPSPRAATPTRKATTPHPAPTTTRPTHAGPPPSQHSGPATGTAAQFAQQIVDMVNGERAKNGCGPLRIDPRLQAAAQAHSDDMAARNYYEHDTPEGVDPGTRMTKAGYTWSRWGENIYKSPQDPATAMNGWMNSPAHRDNILDCRFKDTGVGVNLNSNGPWWTEDFGTS